MAGNPRGGIGKTAAAAPLGRPSRTASCTPSRWARWQFSNPVSTIAITPDASLEESKEEPQRANVKEHRKSGVQFSATLALSWR
jgi:hypothetical protein